VSGTFEPVAEDIQFRALVGASHPQRGVACIRKSKNADRKFKLFIRDDHAVAELCCIIRIGIRNDETIGGDENVIAGNFAGQHWWPGATCQKRGQYTSTQAREAAKLNKFFPIHLQRLQEIYEGVEVLRR